MSTFLIAELGSCHDGDWRQVQRIVEACAAAGFSACKLQYWSSADRLADRRHATDAYRAIYHQYAIPVSWLSAFHALCHAHGLEAVVTCYLPEDVATVAPFADRLKCAAFENADDDLIDTMQQTGKPVIISCGMLDPAEAYSILIELSDRDALLACRSVYPAPCDGALAQLATSTNLYRGFSDHTRTIWTGAVAVGCGAQIIEVHVRAYDTAFDNPDYAFALDPDELRRYAEGVRTAERLIADVPVDESAMRRFKMRADA